MKWTNPFHLDTANASRTETSVVLKLHNLSYKNKSKIVEPKQVLYWNPLISKRPGSLFSVEPKQVLYWNFGLQYGAVKVTVVEPKQVLYWNRKIMSQDMKEILSRTETSVVLKSSGFLFVAAFFLVEPKQVLYWNFFNTSFCFFIISSRTETSVVLKYGDRYIMQRLKGSRTETSVVLKSYDPSPILVLQPSRTETSVVLKLPISYFVECSSYRSNRNKCCIEICRFSFAGVVFASRTETSVVLKYKSLF